MFPESVPVNEHVRAGRFVAPYQATRAKKPAKPPMSDEEAARIADDVFKWHNSPGRRGASASHAAMIGGWLHVTGFDDEGRILAAKKEYTARVLAVIDAAKQRQADGLAPHTPQAKNVNLSPAARRRPSAWFSGTATAML